jgi:hypothetical protein
MRILSYGLFLLTAGFFACHKSGKPPTNSGGPSGGPTSPTGSMNIDIEYSDGFTPETYELIIGEPGGSILLDTTATSVTLDVYAPATATSFQPITWLTSQKSKLMGSVNISDLILKEFSLENVAGMNYGAYLSYMCSPTVGQSRVITSDAGITKAF